MYRAPVYALLCGFYAQTVRNDVENLRSVGHVYVQIFCSVRKIQDKQFKITYKFWTLYVSIKFKMSLFAKRRINIAFRSTE